MLYTEVLLWCLGLPYTPKYLFRVQFVLHVVYGCQLHVLLLFGSFRDDGVFGSVRHPVFGDTELLALLYVDVHYYYC